MKSQAESWLAAIVADDFESQSRVIECMKNNIPVYGAPLQFPCTISEPYAEQFPTVATMHDLSILVFFGDKVRAYK